MKQTILTFEKCDIFITELPDVKEIRIERDIIKNLLVLEEVFCVYDGEKYLFRVPHPIGLIGKLSELTEEDFDKIVDEPFWVDDYVSMVYKNYHTVSEVEHTAQESFLSKLRSQGYYADNPCTTYQECVMYEQQAKYEYTFSPDRTFIFKIVKQ